VGCHIEEEPVLAGIREIVLESPAEAGLLVKVRVIDVEVAPVTFKTLQEKEDGWPFGFLLGSSREPFDNQKCRARHAFTV